jgi:hypothetical protein
MVCYDASVPYSTPTRRWVDHLPPPSPDTYTHWGVLKPDNIPEPNNLYPPEGCSVANYSEELI